MQHFSDTTADEAVRTARDVFHAAWVELRSALVYISNAASTWRQEAMRQKATWRGVGA